MKYLYMAVTADEYELPIAVEDTAVALAEKMGVKPPTIHTSILRGRSGRGKGIKFVKVCESEEG